MSCIPSQAHLAEAAARELAVALQDLAWLLPRTIGQAPDRAIDELPLSELEVMRLLVRRPGLRVGDVARELGLQESNTSSAIRGLVAHGLIERRRDERDGRVVRLFPTQLAAHSRARREAAWGIAMAERLDTLTAPEVRTLVGAVPALRRLAQSLGSSHSDADA